MILCSLEMSYLKTLYCEVLGIEYCKRWVTGPLLPIGLRKIFKYNCKFTLAVWVSVTGSYSLLMTALPVLMIIILHITVRNNEARILV